MTVRVVIQSTLWAAATVVSAAGRCRVLTNPIHTRVLSARIVVRAVDRRVSANPLHTAVLGARIVVGAVDRATSLSIRLCTEILQYHLDNDAEAERIAGALNADYPAHEYPITPREARRRGLNVKNLDPELNATLLELNQLYSEMGQRAVTDYDEFNYHNNEIVNIIEGPGAQFYFQNDKDWHYRKEERQWSSLHVESGWYRSVIEKGRVKRFRLYMS